MRGWAFAGLLTACYAPAAPTGAPCGEGGACPSGQVCTLGQCTVPGTVVEADASVPLDAFVMPLDAPFDAPPVPPVMKFGDRAGALADTLFDVFLDGTSNTGIHDDLHLTSSASGPLLFRVDVTAVPTYATVTSARLSLFVSFESIPINTVIDVFLMNESWTEGTEDFAPGVANVDDRNVGEPWTTSGARAPSRSATPIASTTVAANLDPGEELSITIPPATVAAWIANSATNHGIALIAQGSFYVELRSTEAGETAERPMLELMLQ